MSATKILKCLSSFFVVLLLCISGGAALALNILVSNDDGYQSPNLRALYHSLKEAGHQVLVSAPETDQSAQSASVHFFQPVTVGQDSSQPNIHYLSGTPVMAVLYGIDVLSKKQWQQKPDLIISGINCGHNTGLINPFSGTVAVAVTALRRGIPAIAISGPSGHHCGSASDSLIYLVKPIIAALTNKLPMLPEGFGLNINLPDPTQLPAHHSPYKITWTGNFSNTVPLFVEDMSLFSTISQLELPKEPGLVFTPYEFIDTTPADLDLTSEGRTVNKGYVSISLIDGKYGIARRHYHHNERQALKQLKEKLSPLLENLLSSE